MKMRTPGACAAAAALVIGMAPARMALAVDGQVVINQARAMAGGVTPGDAPGFPVTISQPGSYILSGNLLLPSAEMDGITIAADHVTIDLNGFAITGPVDCSGGLDPCANGGTGNHHGIGTPHDSDFMRPAYFNITIRNGTIQGLRDGINLFGDSHLVEFVHARSNSRLGISIIPGADRGGSIVRHCTAQRNASVGIFLHIGIAAQNILNTNDVGIQMLQGVASQNVLTRNADYGLFVGDETTYVGNVMVENARNGLHGTNGGGNTCDSHTC